MDQGVDFPLEYSSPREVQWRAHFVLSCLVNMFAINELLQVTNNITEAIRIVAVGLFF